MSNPTASVALPDHVDTPRRDVAAIVFRVTSLAMAVFVLAGPGGAAYLPAPWRVVGEPDPNVSFELHRWHVTDITAFATILIVGALLACSVAPRRSRPAAQAFLVATATLGVAGLFARDPAVIVVPCVALSVLFLATYPERRQLLRRHREPARRLATSAAAAVATPYLLYDVARNLHAHVTDTGEHGEMGHWAIGAALSLSLLLAGWLAAHGGRAGRGLGVAVAATYAYLGVAALTIPRHDGSWSTLGGVIALVVATGLVVGVRRDGSGPVGEPADRRGTA